MSKVCEREWCRQEAVETYLGDTVVFWRYLFSCRHLDTISERLLRLDGDPSMFRMWYFSLVQREHRFVMLEYAPEHARVTIQPKQALGNGVRVPT